MCAILWSGILKGSNFLEDKGVYGKIIFIRSQRKKMRMFELDSTGSGQGSLASFGKDPSGLIKVWEFSDHVSDYQFTKKDLKPCSWDVS